MLTSANISYITSHSLQYLIKIINILAYPKNFQQFYVTVSESSEKYPKTFP